MEQSFITMPNITSLLFFLYNGNKYNLVLNIIDIVFCHKMIFAGGHLGFVRVRHTGMTRYF